MKEYDVPQDLPEEQQLQYVKLVMEARKLDSEQRLQAFEDLLATHLRYVETVKELIRNKF